MRKTVAVIMSLIWITACGGSSSPKSDAPQVNGHPDPVVVANKIGCTHPVPEQGGPELYMASQVICQYKGDQTQIGTFESSSSQKIWEQAAKQVTGGDGDIVIGPLYVVEASDADAAAQIAKLIGGSTQ